MVADAMSAIRTALERFNDYKQAFGDADAGVLRGEWERCVEAERQERQAEAERQERQAEAEAERQERQAEAEAERRKEIRLAEIEAEKSKQQGVSAKLLFSSCLRPLFLLSCCICSFQSCFALELALAINSFLCVPFALL
jgi:hypothetical protein